MILWSKPMGAEKTSKKKCIVPQFQPCLQEAFISVKNCWAVTFLYHFFSMWKYFVMGTCSISHIAVGFSDKFFSFSDQPWNQYDYCGLKFKWVCAYINAMCQPVCWDSFESVQCPDYCLVLVFPFSILLPLTLRLDGRFETSTFYTVQC